MAINGCTNPDQNPDHAVTALPDTDAVGVPVSEAEPDGAVSPAGGTPEPGFPEADIPAAPCKVKRRRRPARRYDPYERAVALSVFGILIILVLIKIILNPVVVAGVSMYPTFHDGDVVKSKTLFTRDDIRCGMVVVFRNGGKTLIKRVEGLPGDRILIRDGVLYRNGEPVAENFPPMDAGTGEFTDLTLEDNMYFVLGDNRNHSGDSRLFGPVAYDAVIALIPDEKPLYRPPEDHTEEGGAVSHD